MFKRKFIFIVEKLKKLLKTSYQVQTYDRTASGQRFFMSRRYNNQHRAGELK